MKNFYEIPEMNVVCFEIEDVIATSKAGIEDGGANTEGGWGPPM